MKALHLVRRNGASMSLAALLTLSSLTSFAQTPAARTPAGLSQPTAVPRRPTANNSAPAAPVCQTIPARNGAGIDAFSQGGFSMCCALANPGDPTPAGYIDSGIPRAAGCQGGTAYTFNRNNGTSAACVTFIRNMPSSQRQVTLFMCNRASERAPLQHAAEAFARARSGGLLQRVNF